MSARPRPITAILLVACLAPMRANAQHAKEEPVSAAKAPAHKASAGEHPAAVPGVPATTATHVNADLKTAPTKTAATTTPAAKTAEVKTTAAHEESAKPAETKKAAASSAAAREPVAKKDDLKGAIARIDHQVAEMKKPGPRVTAAAGPLAAAVPAPRIRLLWRSALAWPTAIGGTAVGSDDESHVISLTWR